jgi:hypothetical protein
MTFNARLDAVSKAKQAYVLARTTLENRLREQMRNELNNLQTQVDIAVRYAVDAGESKASILRALGTKDYGTINSSLERTQAVAEIKGTDPLDSVYGIEVTDEGEQFFYATYVNHGSQRYNGKARFKIKKLDDGRLMFMALTPLWSDDYTVRNDAVVALDGKTDGDYYEEAVKWVLS